MNDIAYVEFETVSPLFFDPYTQNRIAGSFILIDPISNATLGAGMIRADLSGGKAVADAATAEPVTAAERYKRHGHYPALIVVENNPSLATRLERALFDEHFEVLLVDGSDVPASVLERQYAGFESAGFVVIYSCDALDFEAKRRLENLAASRYFHSSPVPGSVKDPDDANAILSRVRSLRA